MQSERLELRVEILEQIVTGTGGVIDRLERVDAKVDRIHSVVDSFRKEFLQFRDETRIELSAIRADLGGRIETSEHGVRTDLGGQIAASERAIRADVAAQIVATERVLRGEMRERRDDLVNRIETGDRETQTQMRVLHEDLVERIELLGDGLSANRY